MGLVEIYNPILFAVPPAHQTERGLQDRVGDNTEEGGKRNKEFIQNDRIVGPS